MPSASIACDLQRWVRRRLLGPLLLVALGFLLGWGAGNREPRHGAAIHAPR